MAGWSKSGCERSGAREWLCVVGLAVCWSGAVLGAQDRVSTSIPADAHGGPTPTLHVYENLLQASVLVLQPNRDRIGKPIAAERFSVSLDAGPWFPATHVRREGDDPISLSILLDVGGDGGLLMPMMAGAIAGLAPGSLQPQDRVSVYALDCSLVKAASDVPADSAGLKQAVDEGLSSWTARSSKKRAKGAESDCKKPEYLWDALAELTDGLHKLPGRRVILVMSDGEDKGSAHTWNQVRAEAQVAGVAIFGLKYTPDPEVVNSTSTENRFGSGDRFGMSTDAAPATDTKPAVTLDSENPFLNLCELTGGTVRLTSPKKVEKKLQEFTVMVRQRYVVEFPRPTNGQVGMHGLSVRISKGDYFISSAGITFALMDPAVLADPTTVASDPSKAPTMGSRHSLPSPR
jgi:hypothetical protein